MKVEVNPNIAVEATADTADVIDREVEESYEIFKLIFKDSSKTENEFLWWVENIFGSKWHPEALQAFKGLKLGKQKFEKSQRKELSLLPFPSRFPGISGSTKIKYGALHVLYVIYSIAVRLKYNFYIDQLIADH